MRSVVRNGFVSVYDPLSKQKNETKTFLKNYTKDFPNLQDAKSYYVCIHFYLPFPKSINKSEKNILSWIRDCANKKPDIDNLAKFYLDCCNEIIYSDDQKITKLHMTKIYSQNPRTEIHIMKNKELDLPKEVLGILEIFDINEYKEFINELTKINMHVDFFKEASSDNTNESDIEKNQEILKQAAHFLSYFSEKYAPILNKVKKKWPLYYQKEGIKNG